MRIVRGARGAALASALVLFVVYVATLAPGVTFWDAGEFIAATHAFGVPHPPGTPLFILLLRAWTTLLAPLPFAYACNLFAAFATALAAGMTALVVARGSRDSLAAAAGVITAGAMSSVWLNATETEVYASALALFAVTLWAADNAGRSGEVRWTALTAYCIVLAVPLHLIALVGAPAAVVLAAVRSDHRVDWRTGTALLGTLLAAAGLGTMSLTVSLVGLAVIALSPWASRAADAARRVRWVGRVLEYAPTADGAPRVTVPLAAVGAGLLAASVLLAMLMRARFDPAINQGNPSTLSTLGYVVARKQYPVSPMWPRNAPFWLQVANVFEYADWQVALSLAPTVIPSAWRVLGTVAFAWLAIAGFVDHARADRRSWAALLVLLVCGSLGVAVYLNLRMGPSFGYGFVPADALREARERDYFFVLGFWAWGVWAGYGAVSLARRYARFAWIGAAVAALPIALNWNAVSRAGGLGAEMPREFAHVLLDAAPRNAVLFVAGDNDTYPLWEAQQVDSLRRDVTIVTLPLLAAGWYQQEIARRSHLLGDAAGELEWRAAAKEIAQDAVRAGRPLAVAVTVEVADRAQLTPSGDAWALRGPVAVRVPADSAAGPGTLVVDSVPTRAFAARIARWRAGRPVRPSTDPVDAYIARVLACPEYALTGADSGRASPLASTCNLR